MNILMLGRWLPPPRRPVRATREYHFARHLVSSHRLTLAFITDTPDAGGAISALRSEFGDLEFAAVPRGWKSLASAIRLATGESCTLSYFRSEALRTRLSDRLRSSHYDLVFVSSSSMIQYALDIDPPVPLIVDFGEVDSEWWVRQAARGSFPASRFFRTEAARLRAAEAAAARRAARTLTETTEGAQIVQSFAPGTPITVIPNGVDVEFFGASLRVGKAPTVVLCTSLTGEAEVRDAVDFFRSVVPTVRSRVPSVRFLLAGKNPLPAGRLGADLVGVDVAAPVSDLRPLLHSQAVAAAPLRAGSDLRSSALEPMAAGVPVVATSKVGQQLGARAGRDLWVADEPLDFALHIVQLLEDPARRTALGERGKAYITAHHAWSVMAAKLGEIVAAFAGPRPAALIPPTAVGVAPVRVLPHARLDREAS